MLASLACALRRLACRCWAGRVALRENRARQHLLAAPRGSEVLARAECRAVGTARSRRGIVAFAHLAREGRMAVTIGGGNCWSHSAARLPRGRSQVARS